MKLFKKLILKMKMIKDMIQKINSELIKTLENKKILLQIEKIINKYTILQLIKCVNMQEK